MWLPSLKTLVKIQVGKTVDLYIGWWYFKITHSCSHGSLGSNVERKHYNHCVSVKSRGTEPREWIDIKQGIIIVAYSTVRVVQQWLSHSREVKNPIVVQRTRPSVQKAHLWRQGHVWIPKKLVPASNSKNRAKEFTRENEGQGGQRQTSPS